MFWHTARDDTMFTSMRCISRHKDTQVYGVILPKELINQAMLESKAYKTYYAFASREKTPKPMYVRKKADSDTSPKQKPVQATKGVPDEQHLKTSGADKRTGTIPGVPDVPIYESKDRIKIPFLDQSTTEFYEEEEEINDEDTMDEEGDDEVTRELYEDVNVNLGNEDINMTNTNQANNEIASLMDTTSSHAMVVPEITFVFPTTIPPPPPLFNPLSQQATPTLKPTALETTKSLHAHLDFASVFRFNDRVTEVVNSGVKKAFPGRSSDRGCTVLGLNEYCTNVWVSLRLCNSYNREKCYRISRSCSLDKVFLSTKVTYEAAASLSEYELAKILLDKIKESKSHLRADYKKKLYDALVESYNTDKDIIESYGELFSLKRSRDDKDKDQDPSFGSDRGTKRRKSSKDAESSRNLRSKEKKSSSTSKDASQSQHKHDSKFAHVEEPSHTVDDSGVQQDQEFDTGNNDEQPADKEVPNRKHFYGFAANMTSSKDVYSRKRIIVITRLSIMEKYDYGHLEEIEVCREDQKLYKFKEGDFPRLRLQDIEDMLLLLVQQKLTNLIIEKWTTYTAYSDPKGVIYKDQMNRNRLMRADELHKFSDGMPDDVRSALNDIAKGIRMEYLPKRK
uniref:Uncharacterized protein n=1 Tax=Tanacetum cinerariifolium TaxID=118510 RepID=A0A699GH46_TANCI|nr:hypothetical protein [Tanacetum cinerariifolium]